MEIYDDLPEGPEFRNIAVETMKKDWLDSIRPEIAVPYGDALLDIVDARLRAIEADIDITVSIMRRTLERNLDITRSDVEQEEYSLGLAAQAVYYGVDERTGPTGVEAFDDLSAKEDALLNNVSSPESQLELFLTLDSASRLAQMIHYTTTPGSLAC